VSEDNPMRMRVEVWKPESVGVYSGDVVGGLTVRGQKIEPYIGDENDFLALYDDNDEPDKPPRTAIMIDGRAVDRWELLKWFSGAKGIRMRVEIDNIRYSLVVKADFTAGEGP
jgi:hypothetical protein